VNAVANSSPLIVFAKLNCFDLLHALYPQVHISEEVYKEVVVSGTGLSGASEVAKAQWIEVRRVPNQCELQTLKEKYALGIGELSTVVLAKEFRADVVLLDDSSARKFAKAEGLQVQGSVGLLETLYLRGHLADLRATFRQLLEHAYIDQRLLDHRLRALGLLPL
jgi:predicted nucleic acid-binding protein